MEGRYVAAASEWNCPMVRKEVEIAALLLPGVVARAMIIAGGVLRLAADLHEGEVSLAAGAGLFLEIGEERDHCLGREITSRPDPSLGLAADLGQMKGNRRPVCKRSDVQELTSLTGVCTENSSFVLRLHKLDTFLRCFSCSPSCLGTVTHNNVILYGLQWIIRGM